MPNGGTGDMSSKEGSTVTRSTRGTTARPTPLDQPGHRRERKVEEEVASVKKEAPPKRPDPATHHPRRDLDDALPAAGAGRGAGARSGARGDGPDAARSKTEPPPAEGLDADVAAMLDMLDLGTDAAETATMNTRRTLVLLDFNGTLVHKSEVGGGRGRSTRPVRGCNPKDSFPVRFNNFHVRPGARELLAVLLNDPRCAVAVYTAKKSHNVRPVVSALDDHLSRAPFAPVYVRGSASTVTGHTAMESGMYALFDQPYNVHDPEGEKRWSTKRSLPEVWKSRQCIKDGFGASNTVLIESDAFKARDCTDNTVIVAEYTQRDVQQWRRDDGKTLKGLAKWLEDNVFGPMQARDHSGEWPDVRDLLRAAPAYRS